MAGAPEVDRLDRAGRVEMRIVASGARRDLGQLDAAVVTLQCPELESTSTESWSPRLKFAYADALLAAGREDEARDWFAKAVAADVHDETDAAERLADLDGVVWVDALDGDDDSDDDDSDDDDSDDDDSDDDDSDDDDSDDDDSDDDDSDDDDEDGGDTAVAHSYGDEDDEYSDDLASELAVVAEYSAPDDEDDEDDEDDDNVGEFAPPALDEESEEDSDEDSHDGSGASVAALEFSENHDSHENHEDDDVNLDQNDASALPKSESDSD
jgi:hypothetical protein